MERWVLEIKSAISGGRSEDDEIPDVLDFAGAFAVLSQYIEEGHAIEIMCFPFFLKNGVPRQIQEALLDLFSCRLPHIDIVTQPIVEASDTLLRNLLEDKSVIQDFIRWYHNHRNGTFRAYLPSNVVPPQISEGGRKAIRDYEMVWMDAIRDRFLSGLDARYHRGVLTKLKAVGAWLWSEINHDEKSKEALAFSIPDRASALVNLLIYAEFVSDLSPSSWRAIIHTDTMRYLVLLGLSVSGEASIIDDRPLSKEEIQFLMKLDFQYPLFDQQLLLAFDPSDSDKMHDAFRGSAASIKKTLIEFAIIDLEHLSGNSNDDLVAQKLWTAVNQSGKRQADSFEQACLALTLELNLQNYVPGIFKELPNFDSIVNIVPVCDYLYNKAWGVSRGRTLELESEQACELTESEDIPLGLSYFQKFESQVSNISSIASIRERTRDMRSVHLPVAIALDMMAPENDIDTALEQYPFLQKGQGVPLHSAPTWQSIYKRLKRNGFQSTGSELMLGDYVDIEEYRVPID